MEKRCSVKCHAPRKQRWIGKPSVISKQQRDIKCLFGNALSSAVIINLTILKEKSAKGCKVVRRRITPKPPF